LRKSCSYKNITVNNNDFSRTFSTKNCFNTILGDNAFLYDFESVHIDAQETLGFKAVAVTGDLARGVFLQRRSLVEHGYHAPHLYGLTKLIYAQLGVDENNNDIVDGHKLRKVYEEMRDLSNKDEHNPWNNAYLSKDKFLQYHITNILKNDSTLLEQVKQTIDCSSIKHWEYYKSFLDGTEKGERKARIFKDRKGTPYKYDEVLTYMLGEEQALASMMMYLLRLLWVGTLHEDAFYKKLNMYEDGFKGVLISIFRWWLGFCFSDFKKTTLEKKKIGNEELSFLDVWNKVLTKIKENDRKNWISFDHHGWVFSTDTRLIELQEKAIRRNHNAKIASEKIEFLKQLGFAAIESQYGNLLNSFYVRERNASHN